MINQTKQQMTLNLLDTINIRNTKLIYQINASYELYTTIAENAKMINHSKWQAHLWGNIQQLALENIVLGLCKLFDNEKVAGIEQNNFQRILSLIKSEGIIVQSNCCVKEFINKYFKREISKINLKELTDEFCHCYQVFKNNNKKDLKSLKDARDKRIAHSDLVNPINSTASVNAMETLIHFSINFCKTISESFLSIGFGILDSDKKTSQFLERNLNFVNNTLKLDKLRKACVAWGQKQNNVQRMILFGSKVDGIKCSENDLSKPSDWDIAVEFTPNPDEDHITTWSFEAKNWKQELKTVLDDDKFGVIDFQSYHPTETPHVAQYIKYKSIILFDRAIHC